MRKNALIMGIDVGTSGCKTVLVDEAGRVVESSFSDYELYSERHGWSEQVPEDWWEAVQSTIRLIMGRDSGYREALCAIGLSGQMHGLVPLDADQRVIRPCILWNDQRSERQCLAVQNAAGGVAGLLSLTNNRMLPGYTGGKILWMREHEPANYARMRWFVNPKDYIRLRLTGDLATDVSDASGTGLFDVRRRVWARDLFALLDIPNEAAPPCVESQEVTGTVRAEVAVELGLPRGLPVVGGGGDAVIQTLGTGVLESTTLMTTIGTAGIVSTSLEEYCDNPDGMLQVFCNVIPGRWHAMGVTLAAGASLRWAKGILFDPRQDAAGSTDIYDRINAEAEKSSPGSHGLIFLPYLSGERSPYADPNARGAFIGLSMTSTRADLFRSIMEGVIFSFRDVMHIFERMGTEFNRISTSGGGAQSRLWRQIHADVLKREVVTLDASREGAAFGAGLVAGVGTGVWTGFEEIVGRLAIDTRTTPNPTTYSLYDSMYGIYATFYRLLKPSFDMIAAIEV